MYKYNLLFIFLFFLGNSCFGQQTDIFKLLPDGSFTSTTGNAYIVIQYEGQEAAVLYGMVRNNIFKLFKEPGSVMKENPYQSIKIHGYMDLGKKSVAMIPRSFGGYYNLLFQFKDGKIRIDAPIIDNSLICTDGTISEGYTVYFEDFAKSMFKNGQPRPKSKEQIEKIEGIINSIIYYSIGIQNEKENDDW